MLLLAGAGGPSRCCRLHGRGAERAGRPASARNAQSPARPESVSAPRAGRCHNRSNACTGSRIISPMVCTLSTRDPGFEAAFRALLAAMRESAADVDDAVAAIIDAVAGRGDAALVEYTNRFDRVALIPDRLRLSPDEIAAGAALAPPETVAALRLAAERIESFHRQQLPVGIDYVDAAGVRLGQRWRPIAAVGLYVPGGTASYPSSVLMNAIPAKVAGVERLVMTVPTPDGILNPLVLAAAHMIGIGEIYRIGGAQAIAALAYGTETIPPVDKIVGPGNAYVAAAKRRVFGVVGIDMVAGPSEILVICDGTTDPDWIAMDLFSQAEHDESAQAILVTPDAGFIDRVAKSINTLLPGMPRREVIGASLARRGAFIKTKDLEEACDIANRIAPEHLELLVAEPKKWLKRIRHAGAIFLGRYTSEALGDYCAGPNHVLPTSRTARFSSPLGVYD